MLQFYLGHDLPGLTVYCHRVSNAYQTLTYVVRTELGGGDRDRTYCDLSRKIYSLLPYHYGGTSKFFGTGGEFRNLDSLVKSQIQIGRAHV